MKQLIYAGALICALGLSACNDFLDKKPDIKMVVPVSIKDATLLLNNYTIMNMGYPILGEVGIDDYYVKKADWEATTQEHRNAYIWSDMPYMDVMEWQRPYRVVYYANQALDILAKVDAASDLINYRRNRGAAHFYRAFAFQLLTEVHCAAYQKNTAASEMGIPLRMTSGVDEKSTRASLKDTYTQIISDFQVALQHLPIFESVRGRPSKSAAFAGLARAYLNMGEFNQAFLYADSCLQLTPDLLNYNTLNITAGYPIPKFNVEVLFPAVSSGMGIMGNNSAIIVDDLYQSYDSDDLRKTLFFQKKNGIEDVVYFRGNYDQNAAPLFMGITTSEVYLIKAETGARIGKLAQSREAMNVLLRSRWNKNAMFTPVVETDAEHLLQIVLKERRKELLFRGRRWADLKRLNLDPKFHKTLTREIGEDKYNLPANNPKYAFRLSETVVRLGNILQNKR